MMECCKGVIGPQFIQSLKDDATWRRQIHREYEEVHDSLQIDLWRPGAFADVRVHGKYWRLRGEAALQFAMIF